MYVISNILLYYSTCFSRFSSFPLFLPFPLFPLSPITPIEESFIFYHNSMIILVKTIPLWRRMAWLPFQKHILSIITLSDKTELQKFILCDFHISIVIGFLNLCKQKNFKCVALYIAAASCSPSPYWVGGVKIGIWLTA